MLSTDLTKANNLSKTVVNKTVLRHIATLKFSESAALKISSHESL
jgi:hypothetical protein